MRMVFLRVFPIIKSIVYLANLKNNRLQTYYYRLPEICVNYQIQNQIHSLQGQWAHRTIKLKLKFLSIHTINMQNFLEMA